MAADTTVPGAPQPGRLLSHQEVFDKVLTHLRQQGRASVNGESCKYRAGDLKCAAGCLIPDDAYEPRLEDFGSHSLVVWPILHAAGVPHTALGLVRDLQIAHDITLRCQGIEQWELEMRFIADQAGLTYTAPGAAC
jgi:hypothetical protein